MAFRFASLLLLVPIVACERENRRFVETPPSASAFTAVTMNTNQPGPAIVQDSVRNRYEYNAFMISEGQRLFYGMNCAGCHSNGGGGMGPALMDDQWIYGSEPENIFATIVEGRPNGMPAFRGKLGNQQVWELVAYVRAMGGLMRKDIRPARQDHMQGKQSEQNKQPVSPKLSSIPAAAELP